MFRELNEELLGIPMEGAELDLRLAVKPWLDDGRHQEYHKMVDQGVVPRVQPGFEMINALVLVAKMPTERMMGHSIKLPLHPELLYSQQYESLAGCPAVVPAFFGNQKLIGKEMLK